MILCSNDSFTSPLYLSRVCGDDPNAIAKYLLIASFVPRMRGWSSFLDGLFLPLRICPAYAGVILIKQKKIQIEIDLSRVCGGDPGYGPYQGFLRPFVPRMRGWSYCLSKALPIDGICPAYAGVILKELKLYQCELSLSRVCGDDSTEERPVFRRKWFVPRMGSDSHLYSYRVSCVKHAISRLYNSLISEDIWWYTI